MLSSTINKQRPGTLAAALRKKYKRPEDALRALGLDASLLKMGFDGMPSEMKRPVATRDTVPFARSKPSNIPTRRDVSDQDPELDQQEEFEDRPDEQEDPELEMIMAVLEKELAPEDVDRCRQLISDALKQRRMGQDNPPDFPGKPIPGGGQVPMQGERQQPANDRLGPRFPTAPRAPSFDASREACNQAMDSASRIRIDTLGVQPRTDPGIYGELRGQQQPQRPQRQRAAPLAMDAQARQSFEERFPGLSRIKCL